VKTSSSVFSGTSLNYQFT